jgi:hypothetical protein
MATTTRITLRQRLSEAIGDYHSVTSTSAGNTAATTIVSTELLDIVGGGDDDAFEGWYVLVTSGNNAALRRRIRSYISTDATITVERAFTEATESDVTFELHRYDPVLKNNSISRAIEELTRRVPQKIRDETIFIDSLLSNGDFETYAGAAFTGWTDSGSPTITQETSIVKHGDSSAKIVASGAAGQLSQSSVVNFNQMTNRQVTFEAWVYATAADTTRIRILWGGGSYESHDYHDGTDEWQLQSIAVSIPTTATEVTAVLEVADGNTGYFDAAWLAVDPLYKYTLPTSITFGPHYVTQQADRYNPDGPYHPIGKNGTPTKGRILRIEGLGMLSRPSTDDGTIEIGEPHTAIITAYALMFFNRLMLSTSAQQQRDRFSRDMTMWGEEANSLISELSRPKIGAKRSDGTWHTEEDSGGRYLIFDRNRYSQTAESAR